MVIDLLLIVAISAFIVVFVASTIFEARKKRKQKNDNEKSKNDEK